MKYFTLLFIILLTGPAKSQTNVYHPFPESNAIWNIHFFLNCNWAGIANEDYSIEFGNDTIINLVTYHTLKTFYIESFSPGNCGSTGGPVQIYRGAIRQDTALKKVFIVPRDSSNEKLLYDFNMAIGDTVRGYLEPEPGQPDVVLSIDSILIGTQYRKKWKINQGYDISLIEGIGWTFGLTEPSPQNILDGPGFTMMCFTENGATLYPDTNSNCQLINSAGKIETRENVLAVFPNPNSGIFTVKANSVTLSKLEFYNSLGQLILTKVPSGNSEFTFNIADKGLFFLIGYYQSERRCCSTRIICN